VKNCKEPLNHILCFTSCSLNSIRLSPEQKKDSEEQRHINNEYQILHTSYREQHGWGQGLNDMDSNNQRRWRVGMISTQDAWHATAGVIVYNKQSCKLHAMGTKASLKILV